MNDKYFVCSIGLCLSVLSWGVQPAIALPPPEDIPEEILRNEIITEARSPLNGQPLTAEEYAELRAKLEEGAFPPELSPTLRHLIFMLQIRQLLNSVSPVPLF